MKKITLKLTALLFSALLSISSSAEQVTPKQILEKMVQAVNHLNYEIAFVQTSPTNMDSFRYRHIKRDNKTYAQLVTLDGEQQEIIQRDNLVSYFQLGSRAFTLNSGSIVDAQPSVIRSNFDKLAENYNFIMLGKNRVAGRFTDTVRIVPKDDFRYQYVVFVDEENGLLLRSDMLDREGKLLDQFRVVTLYIDDRLKGLTDYLNKVSTPPLLNEAQNIAASLNWQAGWLPNGFAKVRQSQDLFEDEVIDSVLFSDGLFTFTLYVTKAETQQTNQDQTWKQGEYTLYSEVVGDKEITFIGQLPIATAKRIVQEVKFSQ
ncbi:sigma-E factor regulatory protein RseB [Rodentibacter trehalosifermentans]|uniref:Sigma-E factor regulatory protein RseB n=1 Tax=Rodentibacter trehalosifermentans TaxID=1908263 RepID=A0A1V3IW33_9PAST|nr:sigma-E factor regulatory protein RseB [Rodentibacter trehalosifermentans]OOF46335.1 sigma-E factor regulatory protein RseB [Rodentibacter trehalosifermentans]OOF53242.1 sigma-E factor regulatory protein RseB [Rodentibacter trehalosifermentans]